MTINLPGSNRFSKLYVIPNFYRGRFKYLGVSDFIKLNKQVSVPNKSVDEAISDVIDNFLDGHYQEMMALGSSKSKDSLMMATGDLELFEPCMMIYDILQEREYWPEEFIRDLYPRLDHRI